MFWEAHLIDNMHMAMPVCTCRMQTAWRHFRRGMQQSEAPSDLYPEDYTLVPARIEFDAITGCGCL